MVMDVDLHASPPGGPSSRPVLGATWRKSSASGDGGGGNCVEVRFDGRTVFIRDSKYLRSIGNDPAAQPVVVIDADVWPVFLEAARRLSDCADPGSASIWRTDDGSVFVVGEDGTKLIYTAAEWEAFVAGVRAGEFELATAVG